MEKEKKAPIRWGRVVITAIIGFLLVASVYYAGWHSMYYDPQCNETHKTTSTPPSKLQTAQDLFDQGNYDYDTGSCMKAVLDYTFAIQKDPTMAVAYNNRAYTYMRMESYDMALPDLDKAITLRPDYAHALMNRGDIKTFVLHSTDGVADYDKVIAMGATKGTSVCGHRAMALHNGNVLFAFWNFLTKPANSGC